MIWIFEKKPIYSHSKNILSQVICKTGILLFFFVFFKKKWSCAWLWSHVFPLTSKHKFCTRFFFLWNFIFSCVRIFVVCEVRMCFFEKTREWDGDEIGNKLRSVPRHWKWLRIRWFFLRVLLIVAHRILVFIFCIHIVY